MTTTSSDADSTHSTLGIPSWMVLFIVAAAPVVFATGFSEFEVVKQFVLTGGAALALVVWGAGLVSRRRVGMVAGRVVSILVVFGVFVGASILWSPGALYGALHASHFLALVAVVVILSAPLERPVRFLDFAIAVSVGVGLSGVFGLLDLAGVEVFTQVWDPRGATGPFGSMEFAVAYYAVALPVAVAGTQYVDGWVRLVFGLAAMLGAVHFGLVADWTFVSMFVAVAVVTVCLILAFEGIETSTVLAPIGAMVAFVVLVGFVAAQLVSVADEPTEATALPALERGPGVSDRVLEEKTLRNPAFAIGRMEAVRSMEVREYLAGVSFDLFQERPFVGRGAGAWWRLQTKQINIDHPAVQQRFVHYPAYRSPHNGLSKLVVEYGLVGLALFGLWLAGCLAIGVGALGRSGEHSDLIVEQWGLWAAVLGGLVFAALTPLIELAAPAAVWFGAVGVLTRRSAAVNGYTGASMRWTIGGGGSDGGAPRVAAGAAAVAVGVGIAAVAAANTVSQLYRGWGDHLMLRTYYERAIEQYEAADRWMPAHGDVVYNIVRAKARLGLLNAEVTRALEAAGVGPGEVTKGPAGRPAGEAKRGEDEAPSVDAGSADGGGSESKVRGADGESDPPSRREIVQNSEPFRLLERAVEMRPWDARVLDRMARLYLRWQFRDEALQTARRAVDAFPNGVSARKTLATALRARGQFDAAAKQLLTLIEKSPPEDELYALHLQLGKLYMGFLEEFGHAREHFESAKSVAPSRSAQKRAAKQIKKVEQRIERQRRIREGKPPKDLEQKAPGKVPGGGPPGGAPPIPQGEESESGE